MKANSRCASKLPPKALKGINTIFDHFGDKPARFDEGSGTVAGDSSGYGNNGTIYGATWVAGKYGQALSFNGTNNYVEVPSSGILAPSNITIEFWVKVAKSFLHSIRRVCLSQQQNQRLASYKRVEQWKNISARGITQVITTLSWHGTGSINVTIISPSQNYTEDMMSEYQKTVYSMSGGTSSMLNIKRLSVSVNAPPPDQDWYVMLTYGAVDAYQITVEVQK